MIVTSDDERAMMQPADRYPDSEGPFAGPANTFPMGTAARCRNAWARIHQEAVMANHSPAEIASIRAKIRARAKELGITLEEDQGSASASRASHAEIETREADVEGINVDQRIITVIAAPYEQPAMVNFQGQIYKEMFERTAWNTLSGKRPTMVRANRDHNKGRTVGKVVNLWPERDEGLVTDIKIANTQLGDETLELAKDDCLSASVGFGVLPDGQIIDRAARTRRIKTAYLDHIAFVESPAYSGASVIGVRSDDQSLTEQLELMAKLMTLMRDSKPAEDTRQRTPYLDEFTGDDVFRWASERLRRT